GSTRRMLDDAIVHVVDDDEAMRQSIEDLLRSVGYAGRLYARVEELLPAALPDGPACVIIDVRMPGPSGLELQAALAERSERLPIILMRRHGDIRMNVRAIKTGAGAFMEKPFRDQDMLEA